MICLSGKLATIKVHKNLFKDGGDIFRYVLKKIGELRERSPFYILLKIATHHLLDQLVSDHVRIAYFCYCTTMFTPMTIEQKYSYVHILTGKHNMYYIQTNRPAAPFLKPVKMDQNRRITTTKTTIQLFISCFIVVTKCRTHLCTFKEHPCFTVSFICVCETVIRSFVIVCHYMKLYTCLIYSTLTASFEIQLWTHAITSNFPCIVLVMSNIRNTCFIYHS